MRYLPLLLTLTACQGATSPVTDAGTDRGDAVMLRFDTGTDTDTGTVAPDAGGDALTATDAGLDASADTLIQTDSTIVDAPWWWEQTDARPQCDGGAVDCGASTTCGVCLTKCIDGLQPPDYCLTLDEWQYVKHCVITFTCVI